MESQKGVLSVEKVGNITQALGGILQNDSH